MKKAKAKKKTKKFLVWTRGYRPFTMGGNVHYLRGTVLEVGELHDLGKGFFGYLITSPDGEKTHVAEKESGAFIGTSLEDVRKDVEECKDIEVMWKQVKEALEMRNKVEIETSEQFWGKHARK